MNSFKKIINYVKENSIRLLGWMLVLSVLLSLLSLCSCKGWYYCKTTITTTSNTTPSSSQIVVPDSKQTPYLFTH